MVDFGVNEFGARMPSVVAARQMLERGELTKELHDLVVRGEMAPGEAAAAFTDLPQEKRIRTRAVADFDRLMASGWRGHPGKAAYIARERARLEDWREYGR